MCYYKNDKVKADNQLPGCLCTPDIVTEINKVKGMGHDGVYSKKN